MDETQQYLFAISKKINVTRLKKALSDFNETSSSTYKNNQS